MRAYFSKETIEWTQKAQGLEGPDAFILALASTMESFQKSGIRLEDIAPLGFSSSNKTYGDALTSLQAESRSKIAPEVLRRLEQMSALPLPEVPFAYHADLVAFTPNGKDMFISAPSRNVPNDKEIVRGDTDVLASQLNFFGYKVSSLPRETFNGGSTPTGPEFTGTRVDGYLETSYANMVVGKDPKTGQTLILMPTQALNPENLTVTDKLALSVINKAVPEARVIPIGGHSALFGKGQIEPTGPDALYSSIQREWGPHCRSNVLPYTIKYRD